MKRFHARARGRGGGIEKPFSQITIIVEEKREEEAAEAEAARSQGARRRQEACGQEACGEEVRAKRRSEGERVMGQKVNPTGLRLGINRTWDSRWYAGKREYGKLLQEDIKIRELSERQAQAGGRLAAS